LTIEIPVTSEYLVANPIGGAALPIRHTKKLPVTINRPLLPYAVQEAQLL
jgi:hypothetical protein